ncbi:PDZ domain-containing protein [Planctomycetes bacterium K23_9]|uniref:Serine endoprotease n=1 Tax=Stieleria marina TaxID=1930275 RepID=A0A517NPZ7_9BACT|nr:serine endoprotease [Planctomycetes bacterium K23_9]
MTEVFRQRNAQRIVGTSILLLLIVAAATILLLLHKNEFFSESNEYYLQADQSQLRGLRKSMDVRILGEPVGTVNDISYVGSSNEVRLTMQVKVHEDDTKNVIWENSQIVVARSFGIGEPYLEIERGIDLLGAIVSNLLDQEANAIRTAGAKARGVKIQRLVEGSPAQQAELKKGDIITSFNGAPVNNLGELYDYMSRVARGSQLFVGIHGREYPVAVTAKLVEPKRLEAGGTIIQFQPEPDRLEELTSKLSLVQESIANVESSMVDTLGETNKNMTDSLVPTLNQFMKTGESLEKTSDDVRDKTLKRVGETLARIDESTRVFNDKLDQIAQSFNGLVDERAGPAFDSFNQASEQFGEASSSLKETSDTIGTETTVAMKDLQKAAQTLNEVLDQSREVVDVLQSEVNQLPGTAAKINRAAGQANMAINGANDVIDGVKDHWLIRRSVKRNQEKKAGVKRTGPLRSLFGH